MSAPVFFNPYLCGGAARRRNGCSTVDSRRGNGPTKKGKKSFLQVVPRGVIYDGEKGLIKKVTQHPPRMFYNNVQYLLEPQMSWPTLPCRETCRVGCGREQPLRFHTFDQIDSTVYADSVEQIFLGYRRHVVPCGNVIRMFGRTCDGSSVCVNVFGQPSYFYCEYDGSEGYLDNYLSTVLKETEDVTKIVFTLDAQRVHKYSLFGYNTKYIENLYRVTLNNWPVCKRLAQNLQSRGLRVYEAGVDPVARFCVDRKIPSFGWCVIKRFYARSSGLASFCDIEIDCEIGDVEADDSDMSWPEYRCASFDIECMSGGDRFPDSSMVDDIVIQISVICYAVGRSGAESDGVSGAEAAVREHQHLFTLGPCAPIPGTHVYEFPSEYELLLGFFIFFKAYSPDILTGYNINLFDIKYLLQRMEKIYHANVSEFTKLRFGGRFSIYVPVGNKPRNASSASIKVHCTGTVVLDMYPVCVAKTSAPNYKLETMAEMYLNEHKDDLSYKEIPPTFLANDNGRAVVGRYCIKDALLVKRLFEKLNYHYEAASVARLARIPLRSVIFEGQQIRIYSCILEEAGERNMILPSFLTAKRPGELATESSPVASFEEDSEQTSDSSLGEVSSQGSSDGGVGYQGATVLEPDVGFYDTPVAVFDFASLYPSIIMRHNLCYSTYLPLGRDDGLSDDDVFLLEFDDGTRYGFVREHVRKSILGELLARWLAKRKSVRKVLAECQDEVEKLILDKYQLALKVTCNAFYGFTGVSSGMMPCLPIAAAITRIGRDMLMSVVDYVNTYMGHAEFWLRYLGEEDLTGDALNVKVIYGDTDSVFVICGGVKCGSVLEHGEAIAGHITRALFREPIKLEFEKVFVNLMMICKKRYVGRIYGQTKLSMKGIELVRKTACEYVKSTVRNVLNMIFFEDDVSAGAVELSRMTMDDVKRHGVPSGFYRIVEALSNARDELYLNRVDVKKLVLSASLSQEVSAYKQQNLPHLRVIQRLAARREELPSVGDRVPYVLIAPPPGSSKNVPNYEISEDPGYVIEHKLPVNGEKYFEHVVKTVTNVLGPIIPKDCARKEKFLSYVLPQRVYVSRPFMPYACAANELVVACDDGGVMMGVYGIKPVMCGVSVTN
ncbi:pol [Caviid betaherpesvirus 2]|uniref:DNA polymerase n=1 Tax=Guinea pig cytomegalovirus (strain 22122) TaxID=103920 RepID=DPOL_GPCMV|nr:pol [Caviid betaherpesvirus 2]Q69025.3 RecName: Full=DNA polymerase [Guinea pig cytomegalovirus (strain 22122 / ATCC VR682) (GPCMV)]AGE11533.1 pol [Caviid betaherpesvirus 2]AIL83921.1 pol [BAC cloning vector GPN13BACdenovo_preserved(MM)]BAJ78522.1 GP54 [Caviid betaherpesvirus 2]